MAGAATGVAPNARRIEDPRRPGTACGHRCASHRHCRRSGTGYLLYWRHRNSVARAVVRRTSLPDRVVHSGCMRIRVMRVRRLTATARSTSASLPSHSPSVSPAAGRVSAVSDPARRFALPISVCGVSRSGMTNLIRDCGHGGMFVLVPIIRAQACASGCDICRWTMHRAELSSQG